MRSALAIVLSVLGGSALVCSGQAQPDSRQDVVTRAEFQALRAVVADQQKQIGALKAELAALKGQPDEVSSVEQRVPLAAGVQKEALGKQTAQSANVTAGWEAGHFFIQTGDGDFQLQPMGYLQLDHHAYSGDTPATNTCYSAQHMKDGLQNTLADEFTTGFNWYMTSSVSYLFDLNLERLRTPVVSPVPRLPQNFITILSRMQFRF